MCVAYPGRVETIEGAHGLVNFSGNKVRVNLSMVSVVVTLVSKSMRVVPMLIRRWFALYAMLLTNSVYV